MLNNITTKLLLFFITATIFSSTLYAKDKNILVYKDRGIKYYPKYVRKGHTKICKASWYGKPFHGRLTANGERYNMYNMTAAHRTYAMGTRLKVTNLENKRSVKVRVNDRGPFYSSRKIDLSYGAAKKLGMVKKGVGRVKIEVISSHGKKYKKSYKSKVKKKTLLAKSKKVSKKSYKKKSVVKKVAIKKDQKVQLASFFTKKHANNFKKKHKLKSVSIVKHYIKAQKKTAYRVIVNCTPWEAKKLLKSKKFSGAYLVS